MRDPVCITFVTPVRGEILSNRVRGAKYWGRCSNYSHFHVVIDSPFAPAVVVAITQLSTGHQRDAGASLVTSQHMRLSELIKV